MASTKPDGTEFLPHDYVFGDQIGGRTGDIKKAWQTAVLVAHGYKVQWVKGAGRLTEDCQAAHRAIDLHFHDLRHEAGSRLIEGGWPLHEVMHMLGHADLKQTTTYLNATLQGMKKSMRRMDRSRRSCKVLASEPAIEPRPSCKRDSAQSSKVLVN